jgi:hypothetical protein
MLLREMSSYPPPLRVQVRRAARLAEALARFADELEPADPGFLWALGRADEVRAFLGAIVREWIEGRLTDWRAAERIHVYVREIQESLVAYARATRRIAGASEHPAARDTIADA